MIEQCFVLDYKVNLYLSDRKLAIDINEKRHIERKEEKEKERDNKTIAINPDSENFEIGKDLNR